MKLQLHCPNCQTRIEPQHININMLIAKCQACGTVFDFEQELPAAKAPAEAKDRGDIPMPPGISAQSLLSSLYLQLSWRNRKNGFLVLFTVLWNAFVIPFGIFAFLSGEYMVLLILSAHLAVGAGLLYYTLAAFLNTTTIEATRSHLLIEHAPLPIPFSPNRDIPAADIKQLYVEEYTASHTNGQPDIRFALLAKLANGKRIKLLKGLKEPEEGLYIEQQIERFLDLKDLPERSEL